MFRGKRLDNNGEWVYGFYVKKIDPLMGIERSFILVQETEHGIYNSLMSWYEVDPATVGQYTGLTDRNDTKIFKGDIVKTIRYEKYINFWVVGFNCGAFELCDGESRIDSGTFDYDYVDFSDVVGNIHDNPELLSA